MKTLNKALKSEIINIFNNAGFSAVGLIPLSQYFEIINIRVSQRRSGNSGSVKQVADAFLMDKRFRPDYLCSLKQQFAAYDTLLVAVIPYVQSESFPEHEVIGKVARFARGLDYHLLVKERLKCVRQSITDLLSAHYADDFRQDRFGKPFPIYVDSNPFSEKVSAVLAGLGKVGKNGLLITEDWGSYVFIGMMLLDVPLEESSPSSLPETAKRFPDWYDGCADCDACLTNCPTGALRQPTRVDVARCLSYQLIENRGEIPAELYQKVEQSFFGCDICQEVCPANRVLNPSSATEKSNLLVSKDLYWAEMDLSEFWQQAVSHFRQLSRNSAIARLNKRLLLRNLILVMGNSGESKYISPLSEMLNDSRYTQLKQYLSWAISNLKNKL